MSSVILYKFRSGTTFEALPLPGSAARLFDVKKAIVVAKKLDQGSMEFDLSVRDATTNVEYTDDAMLLPRGARLVVQRLPVARYVFDVVKILLLVCHKWMREILICIFFLSHFIEDMES